MKKQILSIFLVFILVCSCACNRSSDDPTQTIGTHSALPTTTQEESSKSLSTIINNSTIDETLVPSTIASTLEIDYASESERLFKTFTATYFKEAMLENSIVLNSLLSNPSTFGISQETPTLGSFSMDERAYSEKIEEQLALLDTIIYDDLSTSDQLTYDIVYDYLQKDMELCSLFAYYEPLSAVNGYHIQLPILLSEYILSDETAIKTYLSLLNTFDTHFAELLEFEQRKAIIGLFMNDTSLAQVVSQCLIFASDPSTTLLIDSFNERVDLLGELSSSTKESYKKLNESIINTKVLPAYKSLASGLSNLKGSSKNTGGLAHFQNGKLYYQLSLQNNIGTDKSIEELEEFLRNCLASEFANISSIREEYAITEESLYSLEFPTLSSEEILLDLKDKSKEFFPVVENLSYTLKEVAPQLSTFLSPAFYPLPPIDKPLHNVLFTNGFDEYTLDYTYVTLAHEGFPGHMLQNVYFNLTNPDPIRSILTNTGYHEGWASYVEYLAYDWIPDIDTGIAHLLKGEQRIVHILYALMDIGIHYHGWSIDDFQSFVKENFLIHNKETIDTLYQTLIDYAGNYPVYIISCLLLEDLIAQRSSHEGFSLKEFHTQLLEIGPAPFYIIEKHLKN